MSAMANTTPIVTTITKPATKEKMPKDADATPRVNIQDFCEEHYEDILPQKISRERDAQRVDDNSLSKRVEHLEKAFIMSDNKSRRKRRNKSYTRKEKDSFCI
ncbi:hypothetical protein Tco_1456216 [Tanacetum coccineum]